MSDVLQQLAATIEQRRQADPEQSYVASLHHRGLNKILEKVGEEATEVLLAAKDAGNGGEREALVGEVADLWFHSMVMLSHLDVDVSEVLDCLAQRFGVSGLEEKASRNEGG
ncbi:MAG: phosphoribosyl-ATP diphosphatase [Halioglobus sp.]|nr:phosphoribosyl-ATP diphosphatase [Halioglobus sp.]